jgi:hypothetical protein
VVTSKGCPPEAFAVTQYLKATRDAPAILRCAQIRKRDCAITQPPTLQAHVEATARAAIPTIPTAFAPLALEVPVLEQRLTHALLLGLDRRSG